MRGICAHFQLALVGNMSDEDEVTYDIHADGNSKLTKSLQKAKAKSAKQGKDTTAADTSTHVTCFADPHPSLGQLLRRMRRLHCEDPWRTCYDKLLLEASTVCPTHPVPNLATKTSKTQVTLRQRRCMLDMPQSRPSITLCLLRTRLHADFVVFTAYIHDVSASVEQPSSPPPLPPLLPIRPNVVVDAVFAKSALAQLHDHVLITLYAPFHILSLAGPYPFPLLLGTQLFQVTDANHSCQTVLPAFDDDWA
ncbi:hypothetical protein DYB37_004396 [Aphanomyces astaci]|uniref:Uncharacterized protein n=1 Tax=Aphanomyces astaci TaxID=112090 RepID=A0A3R6X8F4_APHAT|nr:hypothetical protein DYB35_002349 [Aphanomyces astaci]RHZ14217.1 hypothetical protein DYB37_004396 [Aphanomyces astaci]